MPETANPIRLAVTKGAVQAAIAEVERHTMNPHLLQGNTLHIVLMAAKCARYRIRLGCEHKARTSADYVLDERAAT